MEREYAVFCSGCGKRVEPDIGVGRREYSTRAITYPYFMCGGCRLIYIDKVILRRAIRSWWDSLRKPKAITWEATYAESIKYLEESVDYDCKHGGYKRAKFKRKIV